MGRGTRGLGAGRRTCILAPVMTVETVPSLRSLRTQTLVGGFLADRFGLISVFYFLAASVFAGNVLRFVVPKTEHGD